MENRSLEAGLSQKLMMLENAAACVASAKAHLRANSEAVRKDICDSISQQLALIRAREQELLVQLDWAVARKETSLSEQHFQLHKGIGSCQQALENVRKEGSSTNSKEVLSRLSHLEMNPREGGRIVFENDAMKLRSVLSSFGTIRNVPVRQGAPKAGESLPFEMEDYEDDVGMSHKSVMRLGSAPVTGHCKAQAETVQQWLTKMPSGTIGLDTDMSALMAQFEVVKASSPAPHTESSEASSFEVMNGEETARKLSSHFVVSEEFLKLLNRPLADWLLRSTVSTPTTAETSGKTENRCMKRRHSMDNPIQAKKYEFESVIRGVRDSSCVGWCLPTQGDDKPTTMEASEPETQYPTFSTATCNQKAVVKSENVSEKEPAKFDETVFIAQLAAAFATPAHLPHSSSMPSISPPMISMEKLNNFKAAVDKAHLSASWVLENRR